VPSKPEERGHDPDHEQSGDLEIEEQTSLAGVTKLAPCSRREDGRPGHDDQPLRQAKDL
jgi:hypothetical protein